MCPQKKECQKPDELKGKPEQCSPEQINVLPFQRRWAPEICPEKKRVLSGAV